MSEVKVDQNNAAGRAVITETHIQQFKTAAPATLAQWLRHPA